jgi:futalosine hydrolase
VIFLIFHSDNSHEDNTLQYLCSVNHQRRILLVAATAVEMECFGLNAQWTAGFKEKVKGSGVDALITGVGIPATAFHLGCTLSLYSYDLVINIGLAGSFSKDLVPGSLVEVISDEFGDLGAEDHENYLDVFSLGFADKDEPPFKNGHLVPFPAEIEPLKISKVRGTTVNTVHGNLHNIALFKKRSTAEIETMEGAAVFYASNAMQIPSLQIRAISNYVEARNRSAWKVAEALQALTGFFELHWKEITSAYS